MPSRKKYSLKVHYLLVFSRRLCVLSGLINFQTICSLEILLQNAKLGHLGPKKGRKLLLYAMWHHEWTKGHYPKPVSGGIVLCDSKSIKHIQWSNTWKKGGEWQLAGGGSRGVRELLVERCKVRQTAVTMHCYITVLCFTINILSEMYILRLAFLWQLKQIRRQQVQKKAGWWCHDFYRVGMSLHLSSINGTSKGWWYESEWWFLMTFEHHHGH